MSELNATDPAVRAQALELCDALITSALDMSVSDDSGGEILHNAVREQARELLVGDMSEEVWFLAMYFLAGRCVGFLNAHAASIDIDAPGMWQEIVRGGLPSAAN